MCMLLARMALIPTGSTSARHGGHVPPFSTTSIHPCSILCIPTTSSTHAPLHACMQKRIPLPGHVAPHIIPLPLVDRATPWHHLGNPLHSTVPSEPLHSALYHPPGLPATARHLFPVPLFDHTQLYRPTPCTLQYGNGTLRLTTRQAYQLHGVLKQDLKTVFSTVIKNMGECS